MEMQSFSSSGMEYVHAFYTESNGVSISKHVELYPSGTTKLRFTVCDGSSPSGYQDVSSTPNDFWNVSVQTPVPPVVVFMVEAFSVSGPVYTKIGSKIFVAK